MAMAPSAARGWGMVVGTGTTGTFHSPARLTNAPPPATTISESTGPVCPGGGLQRLLGVPREGHGKDQRTGAHVVRRLVPLHHGDRHRS